MEATGTKGRSAKPIPDYHNKTIIDKTVLQFKTLE